MRDAIAYLRLIRSHDDDLAFDRIANKPARSWAADDAGHPHALPRARTIA